MRLYEFADPTKYFLPETDAADVLKQTENVWTSDKTVIADRNLRRKPSTKRLSDTL
jgi:hypothetical protein